MIKLNLSFWRTQQGAAILLIVLATLAFALLDTATKHATALAPVLMLLWFRYLFQALLTLPGITYTSVYSEELVPITPRFNPSVRACRLSCEK